MELALRAEQERLALTAELVQAQSTHVANQRCIEEVYRATLSELKASQYQTAKAYEQAEHKLQITEQNIAAQEAAHRDR